jgi:phage baseplate assembly protein W
MASISFKSVGDLKNNPRAAQTAQPKPVGILTPVKITSRVGGPLEMSNTVVDQMIDNFRNMLIVNHGERLPLYDFGANLRALLTERLSQPDYDEQAMMYIKATTEKYMPYISLNSFETQILESNDRTTSRIKVLVEFSIPKISTAVRTVEIILKNIG